MHRILPIFILSVLGFAFTPLLTALPSIAYRHATASAVGAAMHLEPNDMPQSGQASPIWFMLTERGGTLIPAEACNCQISVYDSRNEALVSSLPLSITANKSQANTAAIGATITFPHPGAYTVALSGQSKNASFDNFELVFPVIASP